jgi:hypothetical protein
MHLSALRSVRSAPCDATPDVTATSSVSPAAHGLADGDRVMVFNVLAETLPARA